MPQGTYPPARSDVGEGYPKVPTPSAKVPTPTQAKASWVRLGVPPGTYPLPSQVTYPPAKSDGGGVPQGKYPLGQGTYLPTPGTGQHIEYLIRRCRYASYVHAGGLSCS